MGFAPTQEQQEIIENFTAGHNLVIQAGAGSGKTSTLRLLGESEAIYERNAETNDLVFYGYRRNGLYMAYNKAIQLDAEAEFPSNVECRTAHSLAFGSHGKRYSKRLKTRMTFRQQAAAMGIFAPFPITDEVSLSPSQQVSIVKATISNFCNSADTSILPSHTWKVDGAEDNMGKLRAYITPLAQRVWDTLIKPVDAEFPFAHDYYLKMWALTQPNLGLDFLLYDEAQDANPCIAGVVLAQIGYGTQVVMVGDSAQAIYGWRGAVDAMADFERFEGVKTLTLSQSFRFGDAVAREANKWLDLINAPLRLKGFDKIESAVVTGRLEAALNDPDAILCRTNAECIRQALEGQKRGVSIAIVGGTGEIKKMAEAAADLIDGRQPFHPEFAAFKTWSDFVEYVEEDGDGSLKVFVNLVNSYGTDTIIEVCENSVAEHKADLVVSTVHKAKGREWNHVRIATDFREPNRDEGQELRKDEMMLAYVAVTRAKITLDNDGLAWVNSWV